MNADSVSLVRYVRDILARYLDVDVDAVAASHDLERDLGLKPLDLVLVALRLEQHARSEFPIARLENVRTVAQLAAVVEAWRAGDHRSVGGVTNSAPFAFHLS